MTAQRDTRIGRRRFFRALGGVAAVAAAPAPQALADTEGNDEKKKPRYRESEEVKTYYRVNRYPK